MEKYLAILEVSRKQEYIFSSQKLKQNALRSGEIGYVTSSAFFAAAAPELYREKEHLVYCGGGHGVLQFADRQQARECVAAITGQAMKQFVGMELFAKIMPYDEEKSAGENLLNLSKGLEAKKALRRSSFFALTTGLEAVGENFAPVRCGEAQKNVVESLLPQPPAPYEFPTEFEQLTGSDNFMAVVHLDGNAMGKRVGNIYQNEAVSWETCCQQLRAFSTGIQEDFELAFSALVERLIASGKVTGTVLPIRPIILAGDDVCFVTAGSLGLECARIFLEKLSGLTNVQDGKPYAACAGVAIVHRKYPFYQAYELSEALCSNAKKFGADWNSEGALSAMDWHIEFGQLRGGLAEMRQDYETEDGNRMELRPVLVVVPEEVAKSKEEEKKLPEEVVAFRHYGWFRVLCSALQGEREKTARGKLKELRTAIKQGVVESQYFMKNHQISRLMEHAFDARYRNDQARWEKLVRMLQQKEGAEQELFWEEPQQEQPGVKRCLFFDAIEMMDHWTSVEERAQ